MQSTQTDFKFLEYYLVLGTICTIVVIFLKYIYKRYTIRNGFFKNAIFWLAIGKENEGSVPSKNITRAGSRIFLRIFLHFCLINLTYITWGIIQERMMTIEYQHTELNQSDKFQQSEFIVLSNRISAVIVSSIILFISKYYKKSSQRELTTASFPPLYKYGYSTLSNLISSWSQYEALKYISFPLQVLAKSCKIVPVMIMGTVVSRKVYTLRQYLSALCLTVGISLFTFSTAAKKHDAGGKELYLTLLGYLLLVIYLAGDSFTSNWQSELFSRYKIDSFQMMFNSSIISVMFMLFSFINNGFSYSFTFIKYHPTFLYHLTLCSLCSSIGQVFIFYAIKDVGPVIFTGIMTTKSLISMLMSCIIYKHVIPPLGILGVIIIFGVLYVEVSLHLKR